ncbi:HDIG domain-containing metalloprotein [Colwellia sp. C1TZA3]|uniref:HDIG domain-containing metalloprotein n=1 Tax=Colwellia sp. C1TZA3 TaxID=2508879 RepID=UPI0011BA1787|nr:HDIG domain-containing metalloprotein [Colwellia sp. C1TZA3]TWX70427.1 HDIG domain-containing protein [Colwellia sp. C1TZA3]
MTNSNNTQLVQATVKQSIQPLLENISSFKRFKGCYTMVSCIEKTDKLGKQYWVMQLSDISTFINVYCFNMNNFMRQLQANAIVHIEAALKYADGQQYVRCAFLQTVSDESSKELLDINGIAGCYCPIPDLLPRFKKLVDSIKSTHLRQFLSDVLVNNETGINFLECPASIRHHHNYKGGLLEHSVDVAERVITANQFINAERDVAIVSALIHDIGKTKTLAPNGTRTSLGMVVDHDELTLEICAQALQKLDINEPQSGMLLRHILTCSSPGSRYGYQAITQVALALQAADKQSADEHYSTTSFAQRA